MHPMCKKSRRETEGDKAAAAQNSWEPPAEPVLTTYLLEPAGPLEWLRSAQVGGPRPWWELEAGWQLFPSCLLPTGRA